MLDSLTLRYRIFSRHLECFLFDTMGKISDLGKGMEKRQKNISLKTSMWRQLRGEKKNPREQEPRERTRGNQEGGGKVRGVCCHRRKKFYEEKGDKH